MAALLCLKHRDAIDYGCLKCTAMQMERFATSIENDIKETVNERKPTEGYDILSSEAFDKTFRRCGLLQH